MSNLLDPYLNSVNFKDIQVIDKLDLPMMQKHHVRILAHCHFVLKSISVENSPKSSEEVLLRDWCDNQSQKFKDTKFSDLFFEQMTLSINKLKTFAKKIDKHVNDLDINDLVSLVKEG